MRRSYQPGLAHGAVSSISRLQLHLPSPAFSAAKLKKPLTVHANIFFFRRFRSMTSRPTPRKPPCSPATVVAIGGPMPTQKQIQANRANAQLSTGPRTEQGKAISRLNALKSGIDARNEAAGGENPSALAALAAEYDREFQPLGVVERVLVDILVRDDWFLRRYRFLAADLINHAAGVAYETKRGADFGAGFATNTESFQRLHRHIIETERSFFTHLAELERRQTVRR